MADNQVLIVGAGPTGLVLALFLAKCGITPRLIEKNSGPGQQSRAIAIQARTLEFYRQLGFADEVVRRGIIMNTIHLREGDEEKATFHFDDFGEGISPYPFVLSYPQDDHERLLGEQIAAAGLTIEWNTELTHFTDEGDHLQVTLLKDGTEEQVQVAYLCGCDGASSTVRKELGIEFPGGTYDQIFYVADADASGEAANNDLNVCLGANTLSLVFPVRSSGMYRLIGIVPQEFAEREGVTFEDVRPSLQELMDLEVTQVNWFSTYRVHHRVADHFRQGRVFLCGDAGHIHSPAGGQGMNTGIGDAVNLAWKLAAVLDNRAAPSLLDTYEIERIAFAHSLVATTDTAFRAAVGSTTGSQILRTMLVPHLAPFLLGFSGVRKAAFRFLSQTRIHYHASPLSEGMAGDVCGGDRLPWVETSDNFTPLKAFDWQVHVYGTASLALRAAALHRGIALYEFAWNPDAYDAGVERDALYLIRPDGYAAFADDEQNIEKFEAFVDKFQITPLRNKDTSE
jgi:2-polyprenyl-6-methoxyphenol hydroxylase-like FAD-dependent oxidoreductase